MHEGVIVIFEVDGGPHACLHRCAMPIEEDSNAQYRNFHLSPWVTADSSDLVS